VDLGLGDLGQSDASALAFGLQFVQSTLHGAVPESHNRQVAPDGELAAGTSGLRRKIAHAAA
jgi:hypothetical protein